jgi:hypothetical protein
MNQRIDEYEPARQAARRWLDRSKLPEYKRGKHDQLHLRWQIAVLRRKARRHGNSEALALLNFFEVEMLSHEKRVESALR